MVFFTCNVCGESLKKAQIQKHTGMCRGAQVFSCIDCGKDFRGDDYKNHVKCISEDQKYGGKNYEAKANKGDVKQQQWIQKIQEALNKPGVSSRLRSVLQQVTSYDNVPRKKAKFQNWMKNSLKIHDSSLQDQVWDICSSSTTPTETNGAQHTNEEQQAEQTAAVPEEERTADKKKKNKRERKEERQQNGKKRRLENGRVEDQQGEENGLKEQRKKKKRKRMEEDEQEVEKPNKMKKKKRKEEEESPSTEEVENEQEAKEPSSTKGKFNWKGTIKAVLRQAPEEGVSLKKLRKKVLAEYYSFSGDENHRLEKELFSLFNKKLNNPKFRVVKENVRLIK